MNKKTIAVISVLAVGVLMVAAFGASIASAHGNNPERPFAGPGFGGRGFGRHGLPEAALEAVADVLDMSADDLTAARQQGTTLQELADEAGVDIQDVYDAIKTVRADSLRERIAEALADGTITQEHADWLLEGLEKNFIFNRAGFGLGGHFDKPAPPTGE